MTDWRLALLLVLLLAAPVFAAPPLDAVLTLDHAEFVASDAPAPPTDGWQPQRLPDSWRSDHPTLSGFAWYRLRFDLDRLPEQPLALYLKHLALVGELWLNGSLLTPDIRYDQPDGHMGTQQSDEPLRIVLPAGLLHSGENLLLIRLQGDRHVRSGLSAPLLGPTALIQAQWQSRYLLQVVVPYIILVLMCGALSFLVAHAWRQRRLHLVQFTLFAGVVSAVAYLSLDLPLTRSDREAARVLISTLMYWLLSLVGYRLSGVRAPWYPPLLHVVSLLTLAATALLMVVADLGDWIWMIVWPHLLLRFPVLAMIFVGAWRRRSPKCWALGLTTTLWAITQVQSLLRIMELQPWDSFRWSVAGALPACLVMLYFFAEHFIVEREQVARQQRDAIAAERGRILQDMHDGMGAQLITALRLARRGDVQRGQLIDSIEESLQDMRLIVDSLDLTEHDLLPLLGNLRFRLEPRLSSLGIRLEWEVTPLPELPYLTPASALAVLRIVQEAINNAVQHANPSHIRLSARAQADGIAIGVVDDGPGFTPSVTRSSSRGLAGMRLRAERLGAQLNLESDANGTRILLLLPFTPPNTARIP